jgi:hypothetical protein
MRNILWSLALLLALVGALLCWGADLFRMSGFYPGASFILAAALACAALAQAGPRWAPWLGF